MTQVLSLLDSTYHQITRLYEEFSRTEDVQVDYFTKGTGLKIQNYTNYVYFLDRQLNSMPTLQIDTFVEEITKNAHSSGKNHHKFLFFCLIIDVFSAHDEKMSIDSFWSAFYKLLLEIKDQKSNLIKIGAESISKFLKSNIDAVLQLFDAFEMQRNTNTTIQFLSFIDLPPNLSNNHYVSIASMVCRICTICVNTISMDLIKTLLLNTCTQIKIENESDIINILGNPHVVGSPISKLLSSALYITLPNYVNAVSQRINDFIQFATTGDCLEKTYSVLEFTFNTITDLPLDRVEEFRSCLSTFLHSLPITPLNTLNARARAGYFIKHLYDLNNELPERILSDYFATGNISSDILDVAVAYPGKLETIIPTDIVKITPVLANIIRSWDLSINHPKMVAFPLALLAYINKAIGVVKNVQRLDDAAALKLAARGESDPVEDAIGNIPFEEMHIMGIVMTFHRDPAVRKASYTMLEQAGELFMAANTDWKDYDAEAQQFILRFNSDYNYITKKVYGKPRDIPTILSEEGARYDCACFMLKKLAGTNHPLAVDVFKRFNKYSETNKYFLEAIAALYSMELHDQMGDEFLPPAKFVSMLKENDTMQYLSRMSGTALPLIVPLVDFDADVKMLCLTLRHLVSSLVENLAKFDAKANKKFIGKVLDLFSKKPAVTKIHDYAVTLGHLATLMNAGKIETSPNILDFYIIAMTAVQEDKSRDTALIKAAHSLLLCLIKMGNTPVQCADFLAETKNYELKFNSIIDIIKLNSDTAKELLKQILSIAPFATVDALLKMKSMLIEEHVLFVFCMFTRMQKESTIIYLEEYIKAKHTDKMESFQKHKEEGSIVNFLIEEFPQYVGPYLKTIDALRAKPLSDSLTLSILATFKAILLCVKELPLDQFYVPIKTAGDISVSPLAFTNSSKELWAALMTDVDRTKLTFKSLFDIDFSMTTIDIAFKYCPDEHKSQVINDSIETLTKLISDTPTIRSNKTMYKLFSMIAKTEMTPKLLVLCCVFLFSKIPALFQEAKKKIEHATGITDPEFTKMQLVAAMNAQYSESFVIEAKNFAVDLLGTTRNKQCFKYLMNYSLVTSNMYTNPNFEQILLDIVERIKKQFTTAKEFDEYFSAAFGIVVRTVQEFHLKKEIVYFIMNHALQWIDYGFMKINQSIARMFIMMDKFGYIDETNIVMFERALSLLMFGDIIYASICSSIVKRFSQTTISMKTPSVIFDIINGDALLTEDIMSKEISATFKKAAVFGEYIIIHKIAMLFMGKPIITNPNHPFIRRFTAFLLNSKEVPPFNADILLKSIKISCGKLNPDPTTPIPLFKDRSDSWMEHSSNDIT